MMHCPSSGAHPLDCPSSGAHPLDCPSSSAHPLDCPSSGAHPLDCPNYEKITHTVNLSDQEPSNTSLWEQGEEIIRRFFKNNILWI